MSEKSCRHNGDNIQYRKQKTYFGVKNLKKPTWARKFHVQIILLRRYL